MLYLRSEKEQSCLCNDSCKHVIEKRLFAAMLDSHRFKVETV